MIRWQIVSGAEHGHAVNALPDLAAIVVDEPIGVVAGILPHIAHDHLAGIAGAEDEDAFPTLPG